MGNGLGDSNHLNEFQVVLSALLISKYFNPLWYMEKL